MATKPGIGPVEGKLAMDGLETYRRRHGIARQFASLGDNAELPMLLRAWGVVDDTLFTTALSLSLPRLVRLLKQRCRGLYDLDNLVPHGPGLVEDSAHGLVFPSGLVAPNGGGLLAGPPLLETYAPEFLRVTALAMATCRRLAAARRVLVYKRNGGVTEDEAAALHGALLAYGPVRLLVVNTAAGGDQPGSARQLQPGLYLGHVDRFASYAQAGEASVDSWFAMLEQVVDLAGLAEAPATAEPLCQQIEAAMDDPARLAGIRLPEQAFASYRRLQPDLARLGWDDAQMVSSYLTYGYFEGRFWQGGADEPPFPQDPLDQLDHLYRLQLHPLALEMLARHQDALLGHYRSFTIAVVLSAAPALQRAFYEPLAARPGFNTFRERCAGLIARFNAQVA